MQLGKLISKPNYQKDLVLIDFYSCIQASGLHLSVDVFNNASLGTSLEVQWLRLQPPNAGGPGSISGQGTRSHMLQPKMLHAATEDPVCHN